MLHIRVYHIITHQLVPNRDVLITCENKPNSSVSSDVDETSPDTLNTTCRNARLSFPVVCVFVYSVDLGLRFVKVVWQLTCLEEIPLGMTV